MVSSRPRVLCHVYSLADLPVAHHYRAGAVRLGLSAFQLGSAAYGFTWEQLLTALNYCQSQQIFVFLDITFYPQHPVEQECLFDHLHQLPHQPHAVIVHDPGLLSWLRQNWPHTSVFMGPLQGISQLATALFWQNQGASGAFLPWNFAIEQLETLQAGLPDFRWILTVEGYPLNGFIANGTLTTAPSSCSSHTKSQEVGIHSLQIKSDHHGLYLYPQSPISYLSEVEYLQHSGLDFFQIEMPPEKSMEQWKWLYLYTQSLLPLQPESTQLGTAEVIGIIRENGEYGAICEMFQPAQPAETVMIVGRDGACELTLPAPLEKFDGEKVSLVQARDFIKLEQSELPLYGLVLRKPNGTSNCTSVASAFEQA